MYVPRTSQPTLNTKGIFNLCYTLHTTYKYMQGVGRGYNMLAIL